jgi:origin recognition complex subunit 4
MSSSGRKRSRPLHQQLNESSPVSGEPLHSAVKRRKLDINGSSPSTPKALQALKSAIGGVFGFGRTKENINIGNTEPEGEPPNQGRNVIQDAEELDELSVINDGEDQHSGSVRANKFKGHKAQSKNQSESVEQINQTPPSRTKNRSSRRPSVTTEVESAEDELSTLVGPSDENGHEESEDELAMDENPTQRKLKRPTKAVTPKTMLSNLAQDSREGSLATDLSGGVGRSSGRERRRPRRYSNEMVEDVRGQPKGILTPSKKRQERPKKTVSFGVDKSTTGEHEQSRQNTPTLEDSVDTSNPPKRKRGRPKKETVSAVPSSAPAPKHIKTSEDEQAVQDIDISNTPNGHIDAGQTKKLKRLKAKCEPIMEAPVPDEVVAAEDEDEPDEDDTLCVICGGGDSEEPNEILLCDNCDLAAHQDCYGVPIIPEGDWLCRDCQPDEDEELLLLDTGTAPEQILNIGDLNIPEIDGFEFHLQVMQKLLLDKLTGRRRLKLYGLEEEYRKVHQVVEQTILAGEGNSILLIGARGCGKTTVSIETVCLKPY